CAAVRGATWGSPFPIWPRFGLVESLSRARRRNRAHGGDGRRIRATAMAVRHVDLCVRIRRSPDLMLRPRRRLDPGWDRYAIQALRRHTDRFYRHSPAPR